MASQTDPIDLTAAKRFLSAIGGVITFQALPEGESPVPEPGVRRRPVLHGSLAEHEARLRRLNRNRTGIYFMVNEGDSQGRAGSNVTRVRCLFVDLDGPPLGPVMDAAIPPSITVESSPGKFHAYWLVRDVPLHDFKPAQQALATRFNGDASVCDLPRLMRVPGFLHHKKEQPFQSKLLTCEPELVWDWGVLAAALDLPMSMSLPKVIPEGQRNSLLFKLACASHRQGIPEAERLKSMLVVNAERCTPPLDESEVREIVKRAYRNLPDGLLRVPLRVIHAPEFLALKSGEKLLLLLTYQHISGKASGETPIVWSQFRAFFPRENTFEDYRANLVASGLLIKVRESKPPVEGRAPVPAVYRLAHVGAIAAPKAA